MSYRAGMTARLLDGRALSERRRAALAERVRALAPRGVAPCLAALTVRQDGGWTTYLKGQATACAATGIAHRVVALPPDADQPALAEAIEGLNLDAAVHGIIVQNPLPAGFDAAAVQALISPEKDVEGVGPANLGLVLSGRPALAPCTALAAFALAAEALPDLAGVEAVVVGASTIVGKPLAQLLTNAGATVTLCQITTRDTPAHCRRAALLCVAVGRPGLVSPDWIRPGAVVIDIGINRVTGPDGRVAVVGDVDPAAAAVAGALTPVPGGVGALTTTILLESTVTAAERLATARPAVDAAAVSRLLGTELPAAVAERIALLIGRTGGGPAKGPLDRLLARGVAVLDGAMGSELLARGLPPTAVARAPIDHPDVVLAVHREHLAAGARALTAATFLANRFRCGGDRELACRLMSEGVRLARRAAAGRAPVLASVGPLGPTVGAELDPVEAADAWAELAMAAADAGADGILLETLPSTAEAACALAAVRRSCRLGVLASRALDRDDPGELAEFARACEDGGAFAIGLNCAGGPRALAAPAATLARLTRLPVLVRPNAGFPVRQGGRAVYHLKPDYLVAQARAYVASGVRLVGGCCGVGPAHIAALAAALDGAPVVPPPAPAAQGPAPAAAPAPPPHPLLRDAAAGRLGLIAAVPARLSPADGAAALSGLAAAGADAVGYLAGWPGATRGVRLAAKLRHAADRAGAPGVLEVVASDQTLTQAQELLLSAHLLGISLVIIDAGVFASISAAEHSGGCDPVQLVALAARLNAGRDLAGGRIANPTALTVGVRVRADDDRLPAYAAAGAAFICLQPVYEPARFRAFLDGYDAGLPLFADILLLPDLATAEELDNEMPAMAVPEALKRRLAQDPASDARGAARFLAAWRGRIAGACVLVPDPRIDNAVALIRGLRAS